MFILAHEGIKSDPQRKEHYFACSVVLYSILFSFSTWGESFFIAIQLVILLGLMFHYNQHMMYMAAFAPIYGVVVWFLISGLASMELLAALQASVIFLMLGSRVRRHAYTSSI